MKTISIKSFAKTGKFGEIGIGTLKKDVIKLLGTDYDFGDCGETQIIKYGWYEFFFWSDTEKLFAIQNDHLQANCENHNEMILYKNDLFEIDIWFLKVNQDYTYSQVIQLLKKEDIDYKIEPGSEIEPEIIRFKSGVYLDFSEGSFGWNSETNESYNDTIKNKEDYLLNGIRLFDFKKE
ncbi:hypothetical protein [Psychroserpens ponticola]|uniref:DUF4178 domain-containing protein n=1 Tax=Psychroserpens ponticola TaxID=2932268 RepID=A0ABY7RT03_9FLAO|nr:hypothetical protein [Psychroserpens ponticola]WCO00236.1 hypothetical protein MUN68_009125 [Psychroserpens ponticola]